MCRYKQVHGSARQCLDRAGRDLLQHRRQLRMPDTWKTCNSCNTWTKSGSQLSPQRSAQCSSLSSSFVCAVYVDWESVLRIAKRQDNLLDSQTLLTPLLMKLILVDAFALVMATSISIMLPLERLVVLQNLVPRWFARLTKNINYIIVQDLHWVVIYHT